KAADWVLMSAPSRRGSLLWCPIGRPDASVYTLPMPLVAVALLVLLVIAAMGMWLTFTLTHLVLTLAVAGLVGWLADLAVPGQLPYGWLGAVLAGVVGGWLGSLILGNVGPAILGVHIVPTFLGAAALAAGAEVLGKSAVRR